LQAFVVLTGKGDEIRKFDTLAAAVQRASDGDTIEIRGNGPFVTPPVDLGNRMLTVRGGSGFQPVIQLDREGTTSGAPLLRTKSNLVLEGLELALTPDGNVANYASRIVTGGPSVHSANCRFHWPSNGTFNTTSSNCRFWNCQFAGSSASGISWHYNAAAGGDLAIDNCVQAGGGLIWLSYVPSLHAAPNVRVSRSTLRAETMVTLFVNEPEKVPVKAESGALVGLSVSESLVDVNHVLRLATVPDQRTQLDQLGENVDSVVPRLLTWRDRENLYGEDNFTGFVALSANGLIQPPALPTLADWDNASGQSKSGSSQGRVRYQGGDPLAGAKTLEDFRLRPDSAGYRAGKNGKDLGADVDLVGPGPAYERWKKTPEYQEWLKETRPQK
jgi:hypothetical protein